MSQLSAPEILSVTPTGFTVRVISNVPIGTAYCVAVPYGQPAPSRAQIKAGQNNLGNPAPGFAQVYITGLIVTFPAITTLNAVTQYDVYCVQYNFDVPVITHYVANNSISTDWTAAQNSATPCNYQTAMANAVAGNVVAFRGGTYNPDFTGASYELPAMQPANSGTVDNPIIFMAYPGETPIINGNPLAQNMLAFGAANRSYIVWDGFTGQLADTSAGYDTAAVFGFDHSSYCVARNCEFIGRVNGLPATGGNNAPVWWVFATGCEFYNNLIRDNTGGGGSPNVCGMWLFTVDGCVIRNNEIRNCNNGIMQKNPGNTNSQIYHNFLHDIPQMAFSFNEQGVGVTVGHSIYENLIINAGVGFFFGDSFPQPNYSVTHNTLYNCGDGIMGTLTNSHTGLICHSNIISEVGDYGLRMMTATPPTTLDYNCYFDSTLFTYQADWATSYTALVDWRAALGRDANSISANPLFVNAGGVTPADYALGVGSPCIGTGMGGSNMGVTNLALVGIQ